MLLSDLKTWERFMFLFPIHCAQALQPDQTTYHLLQVLKGHPQRIPRQDSSFPLPFPMSPNSCLWPPPLRPSFVLLALGFGWVSLEMDIQPTSPLALHTPTPQADTNMGNATSPEVAYNGVKGRFSILCCQFSFLHRLRGGSQLNLMFTRMSHFYLGFPTEQSLIFCLTSDLS